MIAAMGTNREIGRGNKLLWKLPGDMKFFKEMTTGKIVVMGRKTWESIGRKPLPNRVNIVITRQETSYWMESFGNPMFMNLEQLQRFLELNSKLYKCEDDVFIIGGAEIYKEFVNAVKEVYITEVEKEFPEADAFFPEIGWESDVTKLGEGEEGGLKYVINKYRRC